MKATNGKEMNSQKKTLNHNEGGAKPSVVGEEQPSAVTLVLEHHRSLLVMLDKFDALLHVAAVACPQGMPTIFLMMRSML